MISRAAVIVVAAVAVGCATGQGETVMSSLTDMTTRAVGTVKGSVRHLTETGEVRSSDRYCASLEESYELTDNVWRIMLAGGPKLLLTWQRSGYRVTRENEAQLRDTVKEISKRYLWMPVTIEKQIGLYLHEDSPKDGIVPRSEARRVRTMYERADKALLAAAKDYPKVPYELKLFVVERDSINAEALPAGYIYVSRKAVTELDDSALQLILGHEVAHVAKRHTSKQIQQRIVDTDMGVDMLKQVLENRGASVDRKVLSSWGLLERLQGLFARYDQEQELQADACSIRGLVQDGLDPIKAREEYLRKRGGEAKPRQPGGRPAASRPFALGFSEHPDDETRERFFREATNYHRTNLQRLTAPAR